MHTNRRIRMHTHRVEQDSRGGGGGGIIFFTVRCTNITQKHTHKPNRTELQSFLAVVHKYYTRHTHTRAHKSNRTEPDSFFEVCKAVFRADLKVSIVAAFLMLSGCELQTEGPK